MNNVTFGQVVEKSREILNDEYQGAFRWSDTTLLRFAYDSIGMLNKTRPESRYYGLKLATLVVPKIPNDILDEDLKKLMDATVLLDDRWIEAIEHCVAAKAFALDESDTLNANRAATHFQLFDQLAQS